MYVMISLETISRTFVRQLFQSQQGPKLWPHTTITTSISLALCTGQESFIYCLLIIFILQLVVIPYFKESLNHDDFRYLFFVKHIKQESINAIKWKCSKSKSIIGIIGPFYAPPIVSVLAPLASCVLCSSYWMSTPASRIVFRRGDIKNTWSYDCVYCMCLGEGTSRTHGVFWLCLLYVFRRGDIKNIWSFDCVYCMCLGEGTSRTHGVLTVFTVCVKERGHQEHMEFWLCLLYVFRRGDIKNTWSFDCVYCMCLGEGTSRTHGVLTVSTVIV